MIYITVAALIIFVTSLRAFSFALWQFRRKNIAGGVMTALAAILPAVIIVLRFMV